MFGSIRLCPSSLLPGWFRRRRIALFLSLRRWGTPNLFGLGFPLCFFNLDTLSALDPYVFLVTYTKASPRTCLFFFLRRRRSFPVRCPFVLVLSVSVFWVGVFLSLALVSVFLCTLHCTTDLGTLSGAGRLDISRPCRFIIIAFFGDKGEERLSRTTFGQVRAGPFTPVHTPPPFQQNAIKDGPGRGRGTHWTGNRTVTPCSVLVLDFASCSKGEMLCVFFILCFLCLVRCLLSFSSVLVLGSQFGKIFGSELLFLGFGVSRVYSGDVLPMFLFYYLVFVPENVSEKFSSCQVRCLKNFRERTFVFGCRCWFCVCLVLFCLCFLLYYLFFRSRNCLRKILLMSGPVFLGCLLSSFGFFADVVAFSFF